MGHTTMKQGRENTKKIRKERSDKRAKALGKDEVSQERIDALRVKELVGKKANKTISDDEVKELAKLQGKK